MSSAPNMLSPEGLMNTGKQAMGTYFNVLRNWPDLLINFWLTIYKSFMGLFKYHFLSGAAQPLRGELVLILGSDNLIGNAFATHVVKSSGTVVCLDADKERGDSFVKSINDSMNKKMAYFYQCDFSNNNAERLMEIVDTVTKDLGDITILINTNTRNIIPSYHNAYRLLLPIMKGNGSGKGRFVFLRHQTPEIRNSVTSLMEVMGKELKEAKQENIFATLAHIYPKVSTGNESNKLFGYIKPDQLAGQVLHGVQCGAPHVFIPGYMAYAAIWMHFMPSVFVNTMESLLFGD